MDVRSVPNQFFHCRRFQTYEPAWLKTKNIPFEQGAFPHSSLVRVKMDKLLNFAFRIFQQLQSINSCTASWHECVKRSYGLTVKLRNMGPRDGTRTVLVSIRPNKSLMNEFHFEFRKTSLKLTINKKSFGIELFRFREMHGIKHDGQ